MSISQKCMCNESSHMHSDNSSEVEWEQQEKEEEDVKEEEDEEGEQDEEDTCSLAGGSLFGSAVKLVRSSRMVCRWVTSPSMLISWSCSGANLS